MYTFKQFIKAIDEYRYLEQRLEDLNKEDDYTEYDKKYIQLQLDSIEKDVDNFIYRAYERSRPYED